MNLTGSSYSIPPRDVNRTFDTSLPLELVLPDEGTCACIVAANEMRGLDEDDSPSDLNADAPRSRLHLTDKCPRLGILPGDDPMG